MCMGDVIGASVRVIDNSFNSALRHTDDTAVAVARWQLRCLPHRDENDSACKVIGLRSPDRVLGLSAPSPAVVSVRQLKQLFPQHIRASGKVRIEIVPSTPQTNSSDCNVFAAVYAPDLVGVQAAFDVSDATSSAKMLAESGHESLTEAV